MTLRIVGGDALNTVLRAQSGTPADMRELLVKSVRELSREVNFKSILDDCDSHARAAERTDGAPPAFWTEVMFTQDAITEISRAIAKISAVDGTLTHIYSLCQSALSNRGARADYAEEIGKVIAGFGSEDEPERDSKIIDLFGANEEKKSCPEWNAEALQLDKIDLSSRETAEASLGLVSSAISILAYSKNRAELLLSNKKQIIRKLSVTRENRSAALSIIPPAEPYAGENNVLSGVKSRKNDICLSEARKVLLRRGYYE